MMKAPKAGLPARLGFVYLPAMETPELRLLRHAHLFDPVDQGIVDILVAGGKIAAALQPVAWRGGRPEEGQ